MVNSFIFLSSPNCLPSVLSSFPPFFPPFPLPSLCHPSLGIIGLQHCHQWLELLSHDVSMFLGKLWLLASLSLVIRCRTNWIIFLFPPSEVFTSIHYQSYHYEWWNTNSSHLCVVFWGWAPASSVWFFPRLLQLTCMYQLTFRWLVKVDQTSFKCWSVLFLRVTLNFSHFDFVEVPLPPNQISEAVGSY